jgi:DHA2 family multidrug resistance protein-like MFS transporter
MLLIAQHLQFVQGMSPLQAVLYMLPGVIASMAGMLLSPLIARRIRPARLIGTGLLVSTAGCFLLTQVGVESGLTFLVLGYDQSERLSLTQADSIPVAVPDAAKESS